MIAPHFSNHWTKSIESSGNNDSSHQFSLWFDKKCEGHANNQRPYCHVRWLTALSDQLWRWFIFFLPIDSVELPVSWGCFLFFSLKIYGHIDYIVGTSVEIVRLLIDLAQILLLHLRYAILEYVCNCMLIPWKLIVNNRFKSFAYWPRSRNQSKYTQGNQSVSQSFTQSSNQFKAKNGAAQELLCEK